MVERFLHALRRLLLVVAVLAAGLAGVLAGWVLASGEAEAQSAPQANGVINTNVFDGVGGRYAEGMKVELFEVKGEAFHPVSVATIAATGRAELLSGRPLPVGQYELRFHIADYFRGRRVPVGEPAYLDHVPVRFSVDTPGGHYHVPLICTPWSYSTYRGS